jgi:hypothetical protein
MKVTIYSVPLMPHSYLIFPDRLGGLVCRSGLPGQLDCKTGIINLLIFGLHKPVDGIERARYVSREAWNRDRLQIVIGKMLDIAFQQP